MRLRLTQEEIKYLAPYTGEFERVLKYQCATIHRDYFPKVLAIYNRIFKAHENCSACSSTKYMVLSRLAKAYFDDLKLYAPKPQPEQPKAEPTNEKPSATEPDQPKKKKGRPRKNKTS